MEVLQNVLLKPLQQWTPKESWTLSYYCASTAILYEAWLGSPSGVTAYISEGVSSVAAMLWEWWKEGTKKREFRDYAMVVSTYVDP